jgi:hypothetical protein
MLPATDQWRLLWAATMVGAPVFVGYRFARRLQPPPAAIGDAILVGYLVQYVSVGLAGLLGILTPLVLTLIGLVICAALWIWAGFIVPVVNDLQLSRPHRRWTLGFCLGALGFLAALVFSQRTNPPLATDALAYHLPAAILWLQKKRIVLFQTWFFNPANTYSPLAGSMFITWLLAPIGNDALARFVQIGPWFLVFFSILEIGTSIGATLPAAALAALATVLSRPFISESILAKDDLFVAACFLATVAALASNRLSAKFGSLRLGIAIGLMLATKYTALLSLPILLLGIDAPFRAGWRWRQWSAAIGAAALLAGPWYLRNLLDWGNPLFPVKIDFLGVHVPGLFSSIEVPEFKTAAGLWTALTGGYYGLPPIVFIFLLAIWLLSLVRFGGEMLRDPLRRFTVFGPVAGILIFAFFSPQAEVRFLLPTFGLMFALCCIALPSKWTIACSAAAALLAIAASFSAENADQIVRFTLWGVIAALIGLVIRWLEADVLRFRRPILNCIAIVIVFGVIVAGWNDHLIEYRNARMASWQRVYPAQAAAWDFVDRNLPAAATIAYSNQFMIYPLYGFDGRRRVICAPVRRGAAVANLDFPPRMSGDDLNQQATDAANAPADQADWMRNLRNVRAQYLTIGLTSRAPEVAWANADPAHFTRIFANSGFVIYRIKRLD